MDIKIAARLYSEQSRLRQQAAASFYKRRNPLISGTDLICPPKRVLIVLTGLIGDTVMSTPLLIQARRLWESANITVLGARHNCELLSACPYINNCVMTTAVPFSLSKRKQFGDLRDWLKSQRFDLAIIALGDEFAPVLADAQIPARVGVKGHILAPFLTHTYEIGSPRTWGPHERLNALRALGLSVGDVTPQLWVSEQARESASRKLGGLGVAFGTPYCLLHPFGRTRAQHWPLERALELTQELHCRLGLTTVIVGDDETCGFEVPNVEGYVVDGRSKFTLQEFLAAIAQAELVISTDSGPFHIAGALGRPLVGLFRGRRPEHANRYSQARVVFGQNNLCAAECRWDSCRVQPCRQMADISAGMVLTAL